VKNIVNIVRCIKQKLFYFREREAMEFIVSEDFKLTPAIKDAITDKISQVKKHLKNDEKVTVRLSKQSNEVFAVILQVHAHRQDFVGKSENLDFYKALNQAKSHLVRQLVDSKGKHIASRHAKVELAD